MLIGLDMLEASAGDAGGHGRTRRPRTRGRRDCAVGISHAGRAGRDFFGDGAVGQVPRLWHWEMGAILGSIALTALISYWVLAGADRVAR